MGSGLAECMYELECFIGNGTLQLATFDLISTTDLSKLRIRMLGCAHSCIGCYPRELLEVWFRANIYYRRKLVAASLSYGPV